MQHFRNNEKKTIKNDRQSAILVFISAFFLHFVLYAWSSYSALILSCVNITKLLKFQMATRPSF